MHKILSIAFVLTLISCSPYQKLILVPSNRAELLTDNCDLEIIRNLKQYTDTAISELWKFPDKLPEGFVPDTCVYFHYELFWPSKRDSSVWFLTIRPEYAGKKEIIVGNLYTVLPAKNDSTIVYVRRIKEYSQKDEFEGGQYLGFTYYLENDTTVIIKAGTRRF